jgi:hypothetical protein
MADGNVEANQAATELAATLRRVNQELADNGRVSSQTQDAKTDADMKAKHGIDNFTAGTKKGADAIGALASAGMAAGKAMLDGKKGASAFNSSLDELSTAATAAGAALTLLIPGGILIKALVAGITMAATSYIKYTQAANEMADQLHKGYQGLAKAGGAAADGMTGLKNDAQKLGLAMGELDQLVSLVAENSKDFALFAGSVSDGRKRFAEMGQAIEPARAGLMNMGLGIKDINEGLAGYVKLQTRLGNSQSMSVAQLAKGAQDYLKEQDMLTKLTGQSRAEMEQQRERALQKEQFAAKVRELQLAGNKDGAEALLKLNSVYEAAGPEMASAFQASVTGNLSNADAQKANLASNGEMIRTTQQVIAGQISYQEAAQRTGKEMGNTADTVGTTLGQLGAYNNNFGNLSEQLKLAQMAQGDIVANSAKIQEDQKKQIAGADPLVKGQTAIVEAQIAANKAMTDFIFEGIVPAQDKMRLLAEATGVAARGLADVVGGKATTEEKLASAGAGAVAGGVTGAAIGSIVPVIGTAVGGAIGAALGGIGGYLFAGRNQAPDSKDAGKQGSVEAVDMTNIPMASEGGFLSGPQSGYLAMLHGNELVIPESQLMGTLNTGGMAGAGGEQLDKINNLYNEMLKDTQALEKLTDQDLKKTQNFSRLSDRLRTLKTQLMGDEIEMLEEQNDTLEKMVEVMEKTMGKEAGAALRKNATMMRSMGGGGGISMPSAGGMGGGGGTSNLSAMGGGQGIKASSTDLLQFSGASGSASNFAGLDGRLKEAVINAASEYNSLTGNKLKINSAKRDSDDQLRLYQETVDAGRPGIGPNGMPVGRPGTSSHEKGQAVDIQNYNDPAALKALNGQGLHQLVPKDPVHFQLSGETGMIADGPESGYQATLHGKEAVIPMQNNSGDFVKMFEAMAEGNHKMVAMMEQMVSAQKSSVDVQNKMLRAQS